MPEHSEVGNKENVIEITPTHVSKGGNCR